MIDTNNYTIEVFVDIKGYEGVYKIGTLGTIVILAYTYTYKTYATTTIKTVPRHNLVPTKVQGYLRVMLRKDGINKSFSVHRLKAIHFIPNPDNLPQVNHKNGIKDDNDLDNLEWATASSNMLHSYANGLHKKHLRKVVRQYKLNGRYMRTFESIELAEKVTQVARESIGRVCNGKRVTAGGYKWKFKT